MILFNPVIVILFVIHPHLASGGGIMTKYVANAVNYMYNPHSNTDSVVINMNSAGGGGTSSTSSSSSEDPLNYRIEEYSTSSSSSDDSSSSEVRSERNRQKRKSYSLSSSYSTDGYYDDYDEEVDTIAKKSIPVINEFKADNRLIQSISEHFEYNKEKLFMIYTRFKNLPFNVEEPSERNELFCGLAIIPQNVYHTHKIMFYDDTNYAIRFLNIHKAQDNARLVNGFTQRSDTYLVDQLIHDTLYYTITRALIERIIRIIKTTSTTDTLSQESIDLIAMLKNEMPHVYSRHSMSHVHCKNKSKGHKSEGCLNNYVVYTKTTSKLYTFIKGMTRDTQIRIEKEEELGRVTYNECDFALPIPFYLVLFMCGNSTDFKSEHNMISKSSTTTTTTTENNNTSRIGDTTIAHSMDSYLDYDKWVCLPLWCLAMYQNVK
jgi:hypothetical protein